MANQYHRLLDARTLQADWTQDREEAFDGGAYRIIEAHCRSLKNGSAGNIKLQTAAVNETDAWVDISGAAWAADGTGPRLIYAEHYLRYIRAAADGSVAGDPVVLIDIVVKN
ncbi:MAG: hypothetical protein H6742_18715 [Alphaproteobacteria bacterium]|nr:hypothetical protein [Alphaproteobacteria bacterium]